MTTPRLADETVADLRSALMTGESIAIRGREVVLTDQASEAIIEVCRVLEAGGTVEIRTASDSFLRLPGTHGCSRRA